MTICRLILIGCLLPLLSGCSSLGYYAQSINGHLGLMARQQPIERLLQAPSTPASLKVQLELATQVRQFASQQLALPENDSYRQYVDVGGEAVVWSVVATEPFSIKPRQWCYLVIGCASYRGYFSRARAQAFVDRLVAQGLDVALEPVPAYSTLGWFDDPLPSSVVHWSPPRLAGLIFHELAHQQLYVKGDSGFNEAFASTVEQEGVRRWLNARGGQAQLAEWRLARQRERDFVGLLMETRTALASVYQSALPVAEKRAAKVREFDRLQVRYRALKQQWGGYGGFDGWFQRPLNNARLASVATYEHWVPAFQRLLRRADGDLADFYRDAKALGELPEAQRREALEQLSGS